MHSAYAFGDRARRLREQKMVRGERDEVGDLVAVESIEVACLRTEDVVRADWPHDVCAARRYVGKRVLAVRVGNRVRWSEAGGVVKLHRDSLLRTSESRDRAADRVLRDHEIEIRDLVRVEVVECRAARRDVEELARYEDGVVSAGGKKPERVLPAVSKHSSIHSAGKIDKDVAGADAGDCAAD